MRTSRLSALALSFLPTACLVTLARADLSDAGLVPSWGHPGPQGNPIQDIELVSGTTAYGVGLGGSVIHTSDRGESWSLRSDISTFGVDLYGVHPFDETNLLAVGDAPGIFRSTDGGVTWVEVANPSTGTLYQITDAGDGRLDAAGDQGQVLRSTDDGATWSDIGPGVGTIESHYWADAMEGWVVGKDVAHHTTDGGATWTQFLDFAFFGYREVIFYNPLEGEVSEDFQTWQTFDGGATWNPVSGNPWPLYQKKTVDLGGGHRLRVTNVEGAELWETFDGGLTWTQVFAQFTVGLLDLERDAGGRIYFPSDVGDLFWSDDLGQTVQNGAARIDLHPARMVGLASTPLGKIHASTQPSSSFIPTSAMWSVDGGNSWTPTTPAPGRWTRYTWPTETIGLGIYRADLFRSDDAGATWTVGNTLSGLEYTSLFAIDGWVYGGAWDLASGNGSFYLSTDLGLTWNEVDAGLPDKFAAQVITFFDRQTGFVMGRLRQGGDFPRIYFTDDAGANWTPVPVPSSTDLIGGGQWLDTETAVVKAGFEQTWRTTNRGQTWDIVSTVPLQAFAFLGDTGLAVGAFSYGLYYSTDAGMTWNSTPTPMDTSPLSVLSTGHEFIVSGDGSALMRLAPEDVAGIGDGAEEFPGGGSGSGPDGVGDGSGDPGALEGTAGGTAPELRYAGPHPAPGDVALRLVMPAPGSVDVDVIDSSGRRVAALAHGFHSAGEFTIRWDRRDARGAEMPAGVYFVNARSGIGGSDVLRVVLAE